MIRFAAIALFASIGASSAQAQTPAAMSPAMKAHIDKQFATVDSNRDGNISSAEFASYALARSAQQDREFEAAFRSLDGDGNGKITSVEARSNILLSKYFTSVDTNRDKTISRAELHSAMVSARDAGMHTK